MPELDHSTWTELMRRYPGSTLVEAASHGVAAGVTLHASDLELLADLLEGELPAPMKDALALVGAPVGIKIRSERAAEGFLAMLRRKLATDVARDLFLSTLADLDELSLFYLEAVGRASEGERRDFARDILCRRKLSLGYDEMVDLFLESCRTAFAFLRSDFVASKAEELRPALENRIVESEYLFSLAFRDYRGTIDEELFESSTIDPYQLVLVFLDRAWKRLPVGETPEADAFVEPGLTSEYRDTVEMMYTLLAGKLMTLLIGLYAEAVPGRP